MNDLFAPKTRANVIPRDYQFKDHDESFRLWDAGEVGTLTRIATGLGKTICACLKIDTWLKRGDDYRAMVVSYEKELVWQFAQEIEDVLGISPGIEMEREAVSHANIPSIVVASRQSLMLAPEPEPATLDGLKGHGITDVGACSQGRCKRMLAHLESGGDRDVVLEMIREVNAAPEARDGRWSRLHKFDWRLNWLVVWDEAHKHAHKLKTVANIVDWFDQNPKSRRSGLTATPKRGDGVSIGDKMFPGVAIDYPLRSVVRSNAVDDGWAVPYKQKYIAVEGVDFANIKKIAGDFDDADLERVLGEESVLAKLCEPLLDLVGDRSTLIFSPGVEMARNVARYINARVEITCHCGKVSWVPRKLVGDGAKCKHCSVLVDSDMVTKSAEQAKALWCTITPTERKQAYRGHKTGQFQFLSIVGLCREGYNDPNVSCVAIFRPVSKAASSLAEQMKGRGCRPLSGLLTGMEGATAEERRAKISASSKPNCIAEGTLVLTDRGEIPIESVTTDMLVWDGIEFVSHCGIICRGRKRVISYAGLTATEDHNVQTKEGWVRLADCAKKGFAIVVTGVGGTPVRYIDGHYRSDYCSWQERTSLHRSFLPVRSDRVASIPRLRGRNVWLSLMQSQRQYTTEQISREHPGIGWEEVRETVCSIRGDTKTGRPPACSRGVRLRSAFAEGLLGPDSWNAWMPNVWSASEISALALESLCECEGPMHKQEGTWLASLRRSRNQVQLRFSRGYGSLGTRKPWPEEGDVPGQDRQQRPLRSWQSSVRQLPAERLQQRVCCDSSGTSCFQASPSRDSLLRQRYFQAFAEWCDVEGDSGQGETSWTRTAPSVQGTCRVFDILNAGPRHRFTAAGLLVSNCLVVDLVGITGLADCASTVQIYAEGVPDEVVSRAEKMLADEAIDSEADVAEVIERAKRDIAAEREKVKAEREAAEQKAREEYEARAKAQAQVKYTEHDVGHGSAVDPNAATDKQYGYIGFLGMTFSGVELTRKQAGRIISQLRLRVPPDQVAYFNGLKPDQWERQGPSLNQCNFMRKIGLTGYNPATKYDASQLIDAKVNALEYEQKKRGEFARAKTDDDLTAIATDLKLVKGVLKQECWDRLVEIGRVARLKKQPERSDSWEELPE